MSARLGPIENKHCSMLLSFDSNDDNVMGNGEHKWKCTERGCRGFSIVSFPRTFQPIKPSPCGHGLRIVAFMRSPMRYPLCCTTRLGTTLIKEYKRGLECCCLTPRVTTFAFINASTYHTTVHAAFSSTHVFQWPPLTCFSRAPQTASTCDPALCIPLLLHLIFGPVASQEAICKALWEVRGGPWSLPSHKAEILSPLWYSCFFRRRDTPNLSMLRGGPCAPSDRLWSYAVPLEHF